MRTVLEQIQTHLRRYVAGERDRTGVLGGSLAVFGWENFGGWLVVGPIVIPIVLVLLVRSAVPGWLLTLLSYVALIAALICADLLLEASAFG